MHKKIKLCSKQYIACFQGKPLNMALNYTQHGHICKKPPREVALFYMQSSEVSQRFKAILSIKLNIMKQSPEDADVPHTSYHSVLVEIKDQGHTVVASQSKMAVSQQFNFINN